MRTLWHRPAILVKPVVCAEIPVKLHQHSRAAAVFSGLLGSFQLALGLLKPRDMTRPTFLALLAALLTTSFSAQGRADEADTADRPRFRTQIGSGATVGNNVLPLPLALGISEVVEWRNFGFEAGVQANAATLCEHNGVDGECGLLLTAEMGPRLSGSVTERWIPYVSAKAQILRMTEAHNNNYGVAFRVGLIYQGERLGGFIEVGTTLLLSDNAEYPTIHPSAIDSSRRTIPALAFGLRF